VSSSIVCLSPNLIDIFVETDQEKFVFKTFGETVVELIVLQTTCNFPDVMMNAYKHHRISFFYFAAFLVLQYLMLVNMTISFFYFHYNNELETKREALMKEETAQQYTPVACHIVTWLL
jgi:hypothetical protein